MRATMTAADWISLVCLAFLWGGSYFFFKILVAAVPVFTIVTMRVTGAALVLMAIAFAWRVRVPPMRAAAGPFAVIGIFNNVVPFALIIWSESHIQSGLAAILTATSPLFSVLLAHLARRQEALTVERVSGVLLGIAGVIVMVGPAALGQFNLRDVAQLACVGAALSYAFSALYARRFTSLGASPLVVAAGQTAAAAVVSAPLALAVDRPWVVVPSLSPALWAALAALVLLCTVLAYVLYFRVLLSAGATNALLVTFLAPVSALGLGIVVLGERLSPQQLAGMALIFAGLATLDGRLLRLLRRSTRPA